MVPCHQQTRVSWRRRSCRRSTDATASHERSCVVLSERGNRHLPSRSVANLAFLVVLLILQPQVCRRLHRLWFARCQQSFRHLQAQRRGFAPWCRFRSTDSKRRQHFVDIISCFTKLQGVIADIDGEVRAAIGEARAVGMKPLVTSPWAHARKGGELCSLHHSAANRSESVSVFFLTGKRQGPGWGAG